MELIFAKEGIMLKIKGKYNEAKCYVDIIEPTAKAQIKEVCDKEAFEGYKIRIMADVHAGAGCTIGTTMTIHDKVVPNMVGVDIGCGMYVVMLGKVDIDLKSFDRFAHDIPSGQDVYESIKAPFDFEKLKCYDKLKDMKRLKRSIGTLGGGNHFIEIDVDEKGNKYLVIHTGSRNLGTQVAEYYQSVAVELNSGKAEYIARKNAMIEKMKKEGREREIPSAISQMDNERKEQMERINKSLCYLYGEYMTDYLHDVAICQDFAVKNREKIAEILLSKAGLKAKSTFHTVHNYIDVKENILRKGAVSAKKGELLLIPLNMRDGGLICIGRGNEDWNCSAPHGAGRLMSRSSAYQRLSLSEYKKQMAGIYSTCITKSTIDESPMAYKKLDDIIKNIKPTVKIKTRIKPIYNFKATAQYSGRKYK